MGLTSSKDSKKRIDEATSNSSLSNLRYIITEKPKWKVFRKREVVPIPAYQTSLKPVKGCPCGNNGPCKQKVTPKGVTIHYPQKKRRFSSFANRKTAGKGKGKTPYYGPGSRNPVKVVRPKKFPTFRLDRLSYKKQFGVKFN